jgi:hypothetical protein
MKHERRVVGHVSGWQEQMDTCVCGQPWPCTGQAGQGERVSEASPPRDHILSQIEIVADHVRCIDKALSVMPVGVNVTEAVQALQTWRAVLATLRSAERAEGCEWCSAPTHGTSVCPWKQMAVRCTKASRHRNRYGVEGNVLDCELCDAWVSVAPTSAQREGE